MLQAWFECLTYSSITRTQMRRNILYARPFVCYIYGHFSNRINARTRVSRLTFNRAFINKKKKERRAFFGDVYILELVGDLQLGSFRSVIWDNYFFFYCKTLLFNNFHVLVWCYNSLMFIVWCVILGLTRSNHASLKNEINHSISHSLIKINLFFTGPF